MSDLERRLASVPDAEVPQDLEAEIAGSIRYLASDAAQRSLLLDAYWPKWDSPWWHMVLLRELGLAHRIPPRAALGMVARLDALKVKFFPFRDEDAPGADPQRDIQCHCALGNIYQVLAACGIDVDAALPWMKAWFVRYQMADGGLTCDASAYLVEGECPSSMVGTIAPFEAMLLGPASPAQQRFLERGAAFLVERRLMLGSQTVHNADERESAKLWPAPCFPRFYFYDVLRGLTALVRWAELSGASLPSAALAGVVEHLVTAFPDGVIRPRRHGIASCPKTLAQDERGEWVRQPTSSFPLLAAAGPLGVPSATLTAEWTATRRSLRALADAGRLVEP